MAADSPFTVDAEWLQQRLGEPGLTVIDASWYLPDQKRDARAEYEAAHIPGAVFFDHDAVSDPNSDLPHTLSSPQHFARFVGTLGISADDTIVIYDGPGFFSAPRAWWMFRIMGVYQVYVLDGGFDNWKAEGRPVTSEVTRIAPCIFHAEFDEKQVVGLAEVRRIVE
ncbi:rhodanese-like domain-containing protein, partial [Aquamicrobium sp.]|uniref:sulfurtransferase n=1 Tax=Aquamicrobium sp. TaxID=1872579 RepID=UPI00258F030E